jgi:phosphoserine phosphatase
MKYKLIVFDLDGTIFDGTESIWQTLHEFFGIEKHPERMGTKERYISGKISYREWAEKDIDLMRRHGANRETIMKAFSKVKLMEGSIETLEILKKKGFKIGIISGSLDVLLNKLIPNHNKLFDYVYINKLSFDKEGKITKLESTPFDLANKARGLEEICRFEGISPKECIFVGDHDNDVEVSKISGFAIAFNSKSKGLNKVADVIVRKKDLREILKYVKA